MSSRFEPLAPVALNTQILTGLAVFGVLLALVGIYGLVADMVRRRTQEIGVRVALGARPRDVVVLVLKEGARLAAAGCTLGVVGSYWLAVALQGLLFGMSPANPIVLTLVCATLTSVVLVASVLPARRATRIDPMAALRYE